MGLSAEATSSAGRGLPGLLPLFLLPPMPVTPPVQLSSSKVPTFSPDNAKVPICQKHEFRGEVSHKQTHQAVGDLSKRASCSLSCGPACRAGHELLSEHPVQVTHHVKGGKVDAVTGRVEGLQAVSLKTGVKASNRLPLLRV